MRRQRVLAVMVGAFVLGGVLMVGHGDGVTPAAAAPPPSNPGNPFQAILDKLDQVLAAISGLGGSGGNHTLRWDTNNPSDARFTTAFPGAVLDNNTGLVWEQAPSGTPRAWASATSFCVNREIGGTAGWRLPSVVELKSVQDRSPVAVAPFVPASAFTLSSSDSTPGVQSAGYWSATAFADLPADAWNVFFFNGTVTHGHKSDALHAWCVRGGMNADAY